MLEFNFWSPTLYTVADVVQHSFIVQNSITPLNLELCQCYDVYSPNRESECASFSYTNEIITTEEKCQKIHRPRRSILYTLHLDLPRGTEKRLRRYDSLEVNLISKWRWHHVYEINIHEHLYTAIIFSLAHQAHKRKDIRLKVLKWLITWNAFDNEVYVNMPVGIMNYFFDCMHPGLNDTEFVIACFKKLNLTSWLLTSEPLQNGRFKNLVYQMHLISKNTDHDLPLQEWINFCIFYPSFQYVEESLKLQDAPSFSNGLFWFYVIEIFITRNVFALENLILATDQQRRALLAQVCFVYLNRSENPNTASEFLRLIWSSVPDSFLTLHEIAAAFTEFNLEETIDIYNFYCEAVGALQNALSTEPRSLKHYCRTRIRRRLCQLKHWLPNAIKELGLPKTLQSYLNLV